MKNIEIILNQVDKSDQYQNWQAEVEALSRELTDRELVLATLENELSVFEMRYTRIVEILFAKLDFIDREIARELFRLNPEEEYRKGFQQAEKKAQASQEAIDENKDQKEKQTYIPTEEMKNIDRKVAKTIHPDFAVNEDERLFRTELMVRSNEAYKNGDEEALEQILYEWEHRDEKSFKQEKGIKEQNQLELKIAQIKARLKQIEARIRELKNSELCQLMLKVKRADRVRRDLLREMASDLRKPIQEAQKLLNSLKQQREE
jgi:hypothetical protein